MPKDKMNRKRRKPAEPPCASDKDLKKLMDSITASPESCAQIKESIRQEIIFLRHHPELSYAKKDIEGLERFLRVASFSEGIFKIDKNINVKKLLDTISDKKSPGTLNDKAMRFLEMDPKLIFRKELKTPKDKKKRLVTTPEQNQWVIDRITESPESCAKMKKVISDDLDSMLKMEHPDEQDIRGAKNFLKLASMVEEIFKVDKNINVKKLLEYVEDIKAYGSIDDKPKWEAKHKTELEL